MESKWKIAVKNAAASIELVAFRAHIAPLFSLLPASSDGSSMGKLLALTEDGEAGISNGYDTTVKAHERGKHRRAVVRYELSSYVAFWPDSDLRRCPPSDRC